MDFLRRHLFLIVCCLAALAGIVLGVTGLQAMPKVLDEMGQSKDLYDKLQGLPLVNQDSIDAKQASIEEIIADHDRVIARARELYGYEQLVPDALPEGSFEARRDFRLKYRRRMNELLDEVRAGQPATFRDIYDMEELIELERLETKLYGEAGSGTSGTAGPEQPFTPAGVLTTTGARQDAEARAQIAAARKAFCYANPYLDETPSADYVASLDFNYAFYEGDVEVIPEPEEVWWAQVGFWVQKDVVAAIAAVNQEAADALRQAGQAPWIGNLPIKEIISVRVEPALIVENDVEVIGPYPGGYGEALPPGNANSVFTRSESQPGSYYVVQFSLKLIMDQRDIPKLIDRLSRGSFHTLQRLAYVQQPVNRNMRGKIYGPEPVVNVVMDWETILLDELFRPLMPDRIIEDYDLPARPDTEEEG